MNFETLLCDCYDATNSPFMQYSIFSDHCGSDLKLKNDCKLFYEFSLCVDSISCFSDVNENDVKTLLDKWEKYKSVVIPFVVFMNPELRGIEDLRQYENVSRVRNCTYDKAEITADNCSTHHVLSSPKRNANMQCGNLVKGVQFNAVQLLTNQMLRCGGFRDLIIKSLFSDMVIRIDKKVGAISVFALSNGKYQKLNPTLQAEYGRDTLNVESLRKERIIILIPPNKYRKIEIEKASDKLKVYDGDYYLVKLEIHQTIGDILCETSARELIIDNKAGVTKLKYTAKQDKSSVEVTNTLGDVALQFFDVRCRRKSIKSDKGTVICKRKFSNGFMTSINVKSEYGNIVVV